MTGTVEHIENLGHEQILTIASEAGQLILRETSNTPHSLLGQRVQVALDPAHLHLFDPATETRLN